MSLVVTLISNTQSAAITPALANKALDAVGASALQWLDEGVACDLTMASSGDPAASARALREAIGDAPVDVAVQPVTGRRKRLLVADMDSTMIDQECIDELAAEIGIKDRVAAITASAMNGEIAFEPALRERVALLKGLPLATIERVIAQRITAASGARALVATMKKHGARTALVSGGFTVFTRAVADMLGFDEDQANTLLCEDGRLTGAVAEPVLGREAKANALKAIALRHGMELGETIAVGDGANDLDMLSLAGLGVALHAKPSVASRAQVRIDHGDLTALLYLQGYRKADFA